MEEKLIDATEKELKFLTGIIYGIKNNYDNKFYIGKTKYSFQERYAGNWKKSTSNILLKRILKNHPEQSFSIFILKNGLNTEEELSFYEIFYANKFNCYAPNGYNVRECGERGRFYGEEVTGKIKLARTKSRKIYKLKKINTGEVFTIHYLKEWCKNNGLKEMAIRNLLCGIVVKSQGYTLPETTNNKIHKSIHRCSKKYKVKNILTKEVVEFENVTLFCKENNFCENTFRCMLCGANKHASGYCLPESNDIFYTYKIELEDKSIKDIICFSEKSFYNSSRQYKNYKIIQIQQME